ncbi:hypothetical protein [Leptospira ellisii]|uniref:hypothetical protein n=1 Tax=Leptospira ellisii TaxID=2023197 RepID=UPI00374F12BA
MSSFPAFAAILATGFLLFFYCSSPEKTADSRIRLPIAPGEYYSKIRTLEEGYFVRQLFLDLERKNPKFVFTQLSVTKSKNREETRIEGKAIRETGLVRLIPESCRMFTNRESGNRWALLRAYDCDHLSFELESKEPNRISVFPDFIPGTPASDYKKAASSETRRISALVLESGGKILEVWGLRLSRVRKNATIVLEKENGKRYPVRALETVETTGQVSAEGIPVEKGDVLLYTNPGEAGPLTY